MVFSFSLLSRIMIDFVSPATKEKLTQQNGALISAKGESFPMVKGIPRFVPIENYASAFGLQWNTFAKTQLDSHSQLSITLERLERCLGFPLVELKGKTVLEVGCGAGRFTELLVNSGALVHSIDLSHAVEANKQNIGDKPNYRIAQAGAYEIPFADNTFDVVMCLGVVQHTPSSEKTIGSLWQKVRPGGMLVIDHYRWRLAYYSNLRFVYREFFRKMKPEKSQRIIHKLVDLFFPLHWAFRNNKILYWLLIRFTPLFEYVREYPQLSKEVHKEWCRMDTYDGLTDYYKHLRTPAQIKHELEKLGGKNIWINRGGNGVEARCMK
ncbi:MAG: class I SAM-dependent methyltransferase [Bacteroidetes bacterium]|nr:class I SAM-dependent methyltransferase [Bacteroidota bacterium]